jgi:hypothetical protein
MRRLLSSFIGLGNKNTQYFKCEDPVVYAYYQPHHKEVIAVCRTTIESFNGETEARNWIIEPSEAYNNVVHICATFNSDLNYVITGDEDGYIRVFHVRCLNSF